MAQPEIDYIEIPICPDCDNDKFRSNELDDRDDFVYCDECGFIGYMFELKIKKIRDGEEIRD